jgi:hypothetical protein
MSNGCGNKESTPYYRGGQQLKKEMRDSVVVILACSGLALSSDCDSAVLAVACTPSPHHYPIVVVLPPPLFPCGCGH